MTTVLRSYEKYFAIFYYFKICHHSTLFFRNQHKCVQTVFFSLNNQTTRVLYKTKTTTQRSDGRDALVRIDTKNDLMLYRNAIEIVSVNIFIIDKMS